MNSEPTISQRHSAVSQQRAALAYWIALSFVGIGINSTPADDTPASSSVSPAHISRLVADLASNSRAVRSQAESELIRLGPDVIDLLPAAAATDPVVRDTLDHVVRAIEQAESDAALQPQSIRWAEATPLSEAIEQLCDATGNSIQVSSLERLPPTASLPTQPLTFWQAIDWIELNTPLRYSAGRLNSQPDSSVPAVTLPASQSGPFRLQLLSSHVRTTASGSRLIGIKLRTMCEPRLRPLFLMASVDEWQLESEGTEIPAFTPHARVELPAGKEGVIDLSFDFVLPPSITAGSLQLKGDVELTLAARSTRVTFSDLTAKLPLTRRRGQASLSLLSVKSSHQGLTVRVASAFPEMSGLFESYRASLLAPDLSLDQTSGDRLHASNITQVQEDPDGIVIETRFESAQTKGARLHAQIPIAISTQKIHFAFEHVMLTDPSE